jgi:hypothetical protein
MCFAKILFFAFLLFYSALILTFCSMLSGFNPAVVAFNSNTDISQEALVKQQQLINQYQAKLKTILEQPAQNNPSADQQQNLKKIEDDLLQIKVPAEYKELHLQLINALYKYQQDKNKNLSQSRQILEQAVKKYAWLSSSLSLFIINNFQ